MISAKTHARSRRHHEASLKAPLCIPRVVQTRLPLVGRTIRERIVEFCTNARVHGIKIRSLKMSLAEMRILQLEAREPEPLQHGYFVFRYGNQKYAIGVMLVREDVWA